VAGQGGPRLGPSTSLPFVCVPPSPVTLAVRPCSLRGKKGSGGRLRRAVGCAAGSHDDCALWYGD